MRWAEKPAIYLFRERKTEGRTMLAARNPAFAVLSAFPAIISGLNWIWTRMGGARFGDDALFASPTSSKILGSRGEGIGANASLG